MNIFKIIFHNFKSYRMISILIILNIIISAFVICFSYGIYQNYNVKINEGESAQRQLYILHTSSKSPIESSITTGMVIDTVRSLSKETINNIDYFACEAVIPTSAIEMNCFDFSFSYKDGKFNGAFFTDEQYNSYDKIIAIDPVLRTEDAKNNGITVIDIGDWSANCIGNADSINVNGEDFKIVNESLSAMDGLMIAPITAFYNDTPLRVRDNSWSVEINFKTDISRSQYDEIVNAVSENMGNNAKVPDMDISPVTELFYYRTILMISVLISILAALNFAVLYRFVLQKRIKTLTIFRICGCTKLRMIFTYLLECMIIGLPIFALTQLAFDKLVLPMLSNIFEYISYAYSPLLYLVIFGIYAVSSFIVLLIMISVYIFSRSIIELRAGDK